MSEKMRVTTHNGRVGKDGAYSVKHNDRKFETKDSAHIDSNLTSQNQEWKFDIETIGETSSFEEHEQKFYEHYFSSALEQRNERARNSRHTERVQTMEQYRKNKRACPEETILQIGCAGNTVDPHVLKSVCEEYMQWHMKTYPNVKLLDAALHVDEPNAAPHLHLRRVWTVTDKEGNLSVSQSKALEQLGIERPNSQKKRDRYNNPKVVFTQQCREKFIAICEAHGIDVEHTPLEPSKSGLSHDEYIRQQEQAKTEQARIELTRLQEETKPFRELEITTQAVTENAKVKTGLFSKKTTVTIPQENFDILLQQAQAYILNRDEIENLRLMQEQLQQEKENLQQMQEELTTQQEQINTQQKENERKYAEKSLELDQKINTTLEFYEKQLHLNKVLEQTEKELREAQRELSHLRESEAQLQIQITQLKQNHQDEIKDIRRNMEKDMQQRRNRALEQKEKELQETQKKLSSMTRRYSRSQESEENLQKQIIQLQQNHQEELHKVEQSIQETLQQEIDEKNKAIAELQEKHTLVIKRFLATLAVLRKFVSDNPDFPDEQERFLKAVEGYALDRLNVTVGNVSPIIDKFAQKTTYPSILVKILDDLKKQAEAEKNQPEITRPRGGMRR